MDEEGETAKRGADTLASGAEKIRVEAERFSEDKDVGDTARRYADEALRGEKKSDQDDLKAKMI